MRTFVSPCTRVILTAALALLLTSCAVTLPIKDKATGLTVPGSIAEIATVNIDGIENWLAPVAQRQKKADP